MSHFFDTMRVNLW